MLTLRYKGQTPIPVEVEGLTPSAISSMPLADIQRVEIFTGNRKVPLAEFFDITGDPSDGRSGSKATWPVSTGSVRRCRTVRSTCRQRRTSCG